MQFEDNRTTVLASTSTNLERSFEVSRVFILSIYRNHSITTI
jgi:hypothetical protein